MAATDVPSLRARVAANGARLEELRGELDALRAAKRRADELAARADAMGSALDATTRGVHHRVQREHQRRLQSADAAEHSHMRAVIAAVVDEEIARPYRDDLGAGSRFDRVIAKADEALARDPHACLRRCGTRTYEAWGALCLQLVLLAGRLYAWRHGAAAVDGDDGDGDYGDAVVDQQRARADDGYAAPDVPPMGAGRKAKR